MRIKFYYKFTKFSGLFVGCIANILSIDFTVIVFIKVDIPFFI